MRIVGLFLLACVLAALAPLWPTQSATPAESGRRMAFPNQYLGRTLRPLTLTARERQYYRRFPGQMAKMTDGKRNYTFKWVVRPSRKLHPASDCYRGMGYAIFPEPIRIDGRGKRWGVFRAA